MTTVANFIDHKLSQKASADFRRVVTGKTDIVTMMSGRERRNAGWAFKKMQFSASYVNLQQQAQDEIVQAFYACNGPLMLFRFRDPGDWRVDTSPLVVDPSLVGTIAPVQLTKRYQYGPAYADRVIQAVSTCTVLTAGGAARPVTVDDQLGTVTPTTPWAAGQHTWSGTFDLWVRFNSDDLDVTMKNVGLSTADIELIEQVATIIEIGS